MDKTGILKYTLYMNDAFNIVFTDDLMKIFTSITEAFDMRMSVFDLNMREISPLQFQPICSYCYSVQNDLGLLKSCQDNDVKYCSQALKKGGAVSYTCHAGLREAVFPIYIEKEAIGFFIVGQFSTSDSIPRALMKNVTSEGDRKKLSDDFSRVPAMKADKLESILKLLEITTQYVIDKKILSIKRDMLSDRVYEFLIKDLTKNPTAEETAASVHFSTSSVNKALNQTKGLSFRQFSNKIRLETAGNLLLGEPGMTVAEVAYKVGFHDPLYFSRIFRRKYGVSPRDFRVKGKSAE